MLMNEADLYKQLQAISGINVVQVWQSARQQMRICFAFGHLDNSSLMHCILCTAG